MKARTLSKTVLSILISKIIDQLIPICASGAIAIPSYFLVFSKRIFSQPKYAQYLPVLLAISIGLAVLFGINWWRIYSKHERFHQAFGVLWDKEFRMYCLDCHKPLKYSSYDPSVFHCSDPKCDSKHTLRDEPGQKITKQQAIEFIKKSQSLLKNLTKT